MPLSPGTRLGPYEIAAQIGVGGMGEVYRATDTKLDRDVAIKVLPESLAGDPDRIARFQREAKTLAALNHPNIAAIYGLEEADSTKALVMELVEGPTLADRIAQGAIPVDEALPIAKQIAEALEAAHEQGIIHRDLKPANIKVRTDGTVKVLDFGLAKALEPTGAMSPGMSQAPTITTPAMTQAGMILGTAAYMSPEQAKGKTVDRRSDVWAFGAVLYEMLTGKRAFLGDDVSDTLALVLKFDPEWDSLPADAPSRIRQVIQSCLQKDPKQRIRDIGDVSLALGGAFESGASQRPVSVAAVAQPVWRRAWPVAAALVVGGIVTGLVVGPSEETPPPPVRRFVHVLPAALTLPAASGSLVALSPDGQTLVYRAFENGVFRLYQRALDQLDATPIPGTENASSEPFFSADGQWLGFDTAGATLMRVALAGGRPVGVTDLPGTSRGASWGPDDSMIVSVRSGGLVRVPGGGGEADVVATPDDAREYWYPQILPGGRTVLFTASLGTPDAGDVLALNLDTREQTTVIRGGVAGRYVPTGHVVFVRGGDLWAVRFDVDRLEAVGEPVLVEQGIRVEGGGAVQVAIADDGTLAYLSGGLSGVQRSLVWVDRQGQEARLAAPPRAYVYPRLSPDGTRVALDVRDQERDIRIWDLARETLTRLTFDPSLDSYPVWTPDSTRVVFSSTADGALNVYWKATDGTGTVDRLTESVNAQNGYSFSPDGESLVIREVQPDTGENLRVLSLAADGGVETLVATEFRERNAELSPDGRWMAYQSTQSGQDEVYVRPFPNVEDGQWQISTGGGTHPLWASNGRELFYQYQRGAAVMTVPVQTEPSFTPATPEILFEGTYVVGVGRGYDVAADGQRFLMIKEGGEGNEAPAPVSIVIVQNWFEELRRLVPTN